MSDQQTERTTHAWEIVDCDGEVVDTADSGAEAFKKLDEIERLFEGGKPYEIR